MSLNSSSSSSVTPLPSNDSTTMYYCIESKLAMYVGFAFSATRFFLLIPLSVLVFYLGHQQRQRSSRTTNHSDILTYYTIAMELISATGWTLFNCGAYFYISQMMKLGYHTLSTVFPGETFFQILICVERYLAVVHPITYLGLRKSGVRIRNISIGCVGLVCFGWSSITVLYYPELPAIPLISVLVPSLMVVSFCSISVLCVLFRPGPGEDRERVNRSKQRAFHTVMAITGVLWMFFIGFAVCIIINLVPHLSNSDRCVVIMSGIWFSLPRSLALPLLFLHRKKNSAAVLDIQEKVKSKLNASVSLTSSG